MSRANDFRARNHPAYWAFVVHRVSGLLLAVFCRFISGCSARR
jgi:fumarate reductase subunit D